MDSKESPQKITPTLIRLLESKILDLRAHNEALRAKNAELLADITNKNNLIELYSNRNFELESSREKLITQNIELLKQKPKPGEFSDIERRLASLELKGPYLGFARHIEEDRAFHENFDNRLDVLEESIKIIEREN